MIQKITILFSFFLLASCQFMQYNENQIVLKDDETNLNQKSIQKIQELCNQKDTLKFVITGDNQGFYDAIEDFVKKVNSMDVDFVMICGDLTNYGIEKEFKLSHRELKKLKCPYVAVLGNHDMVANGENFFQKMYGALDFSFKVGQTKFIGINTNSREYEFTGHIPNISWLEKQVTETTCDNILIFGHVEPWSEDFDNKLEVDFIETMKKSEKVVAGFFGHTHTYSVSQHYLESHQDSTYYVVIGSTGRNTAGYAKIWGNKKGEYERFEF